MHPVWLAGLVLVLVSVLNAATADPCQPMSQVPLCRDSAYNRTYLPNSLGHATVSEAALNLHEFYPLVKVQCSSSLKPFLCLLYLPPCTILSPAHTLRPCRSLCQASRDGCEPLMVKFGKTWPFDCDQYPADGQLCVSNTGEQSTMPPPTPPPPPQVPAEPSVQPPAQPDSRPPTQPPAQPDSQPTARPTAEPAPSTTPTACVSPELTAVDRALARFLEHSDRIQQLQESNLRLERQKMRLEIQLLQRKLAAADPL